MPRSISGILGAVEITVNGGARKAHGETGRPLLFALMSSGIYIPSACGGRGSCGQCKVRITSSAPAHNEAERLLITESDRQNGFHLSCQVRVSDNISVEIPSRHFAARQYRSRVAGLRDLAWETKELTLEVEGELSFVPGQYVQLFLPGTESAVEPLYRAYSMSSPPSSLRRLTFIVRREPGGVVSPYICDTLREGEELAIRGPFGDFRLHGSNREILFIAGGSGLAPIRSMLLSMAEKTGTAPGSHRRAALYFSARSRRDLFLMDELAGLERSLADFRFIPALSNPAPGDRWDGETGGITAVLNRKLTGLDNHQAYLCGSAGMIDASVRVLRAKGLADEHIFFDKFL